MKDCGDAWRYIDVGDIRLLMKRLLLRILLVSVSLLAALGAACLWAWMTHSIGAPQPVPLLLTFLGWVGIGVGWQELAVWLSAKAR